MNDCCGNGLSTGETFKNFLNKLIDFASTDYSDSIIAGRERSRIYGPIPVFVIFVSAVLLIFSLWACRDRRFTWGPNSSRWACVIGLQCVWSVIHETLPSVCPSFVLFVLWSMEFNKTVAENENVIFSECCIIISNNASVSFPPGR